jgi:dolichol kinase
MFSWRYHPAGAVTLLVLCVGDGVADLVGRRFGRTRIPWNADKSVQGTLALIGSSFVVSVAYGALFASCGAWSGGAGFVLAAAVVALVAGLVESLPIREWDNVTVSVACLLVGYTVFG